MRRGLYGEGDPVSHRRVSPSLRAGTGSKARQFCGDLPTPGFSRLLLGVLAYRPDYVPLRCTSISNRV